jgi:hypothetical protein
MEQLLHEQKGVILCCKEKVKNPVKGEAYKRKMSSIIRQISIDLMFL